MQVPSIRVLILEDNPRDADIIINHLRQAGFDPAWQRVETEADYTRSLDPALDLILADACLPQMNALDALYILQARTLDIPFIVVSDTDGEAVAATAMKQGAADYLFKDRLVRLGLAVERALEAKRLRADQRQTQAALQANETRFRALMEKSSDAIFLVTGGGEIVYASPSTRRVTGYTSGQRIGQHLFELVHPDDLNLTRSAMDALLQKPGDSVPAQLRILHQDGSWHWIEGIATNLLDEPSVGAIVINYRDVTQRRRNEQRIQKLNRLYAILSDVNQAIVRTRSISALLDAVCQIAVNKGGFRMAWIGLVTPPEQSLQPVAQAGVVDGYLEKVFSREGQQHVPFADYLFETEHAVCNDIEHNPALASWPGRAEVLQRGYRAVAKFPLIVRGMVQGIFNLYAGEPEFFDDEQMKLLDELAVDLSFAIEVAEQETQRQQAETALKHYAKRMEILHEIDTGLIQAKSVQVLCESALSHLQQLIPCQRIDISVLNETGTESVVFAAHQNTRSAINPGSHVPLVDGWVESFGSRSSYCINDLRTLPNPHPTSRQLLDEGIISALMVLLVAQGQPIGLLGLGSDVPGYFTAELQEIVGSIASHLALAIYQMRLSEAMSQQAAQLAQKVAERTAELQSEKERVEAILNNSLDGILLAHADLRVQQTNAAFRKLLACEHDEDFDRSLIDLIDVEDAHRVAAAIQAVLEDRVGSQVEARLTRLDGTAFDAELSFGYVNVPDREVDGFVCTIRDITERKKAEQALIANVEQEREFQKYLKDLHEITIELTPIDDVDEFYRRVVELGLTRFGFDRMALFLLDDQPGTARGTYGTDLQGQLVDEHRLRCILKPNGIMVRAVNRTERFCCEEEQPLYSNLQPIGMGWNAAAVLRNGTEALGWLVADNLLRHGPPTKPLMDILALYSMTAGSLLARKRVEASLRDSEARLRESQQMLRSLLESVPVPVFWKDTHSIYLGCNRLLAQDAGLKSSEAIVGKTDFDLPWREYAAAYIEDDRALIESGLPRMQAEKIRTIAEGSEIWGQVNKIPLYDDGGTIIGIVGAYNDITQRKQAEEALRQAFEKEKELGELKSRFVSMASHEFRNPLATILAATETLTAYRQKMTDQQIEQRLTNIGEQVGHLRAVMEDVLQLARLQARRVEFNPVNLDLDVLCRSILEEYQNRPDITHAIQYTCDAELPAVLLDKKLMREILGNLVSNAIKYSPGGKAVTVHLGYTGTAFLLEVHDEGIGIPEADLKHLFEPFHRAANVGTISGTGLGLTITKEAVELYGGSITVVSQLGTGTTFTVRIPLVAEGADGHDKSSGH